MSPFEETLRSSGAKGGKDHTSQKSHLFVPRQGRSFWMLAN